MSFKTIKTREKVLWEKKKKKKSNLEIRETFTRQLQRLPAEKQRLVGVILLMNFLGSCVRAKQ